MKRRQCVRILRDARSRAPQDEAILAFIPFHLCRLLAGGGQMKSVRSHRNRPRHWWTVAAASIRPRAARGGRETMRSMVEGVIAIQGCPLPDRTQPACAGCCVNLPAMRSDLPRSRGRMVSQWMRARLHFVRRVPINQPISHADRGSTPSGGLGRSQGRSRSSQKIRGGPAKGSQGPRQTRRCFGEVR
jgi:hypothetical protein